jgi:hypothetical protein
MNNPALDVAIGLIFIYLLYSLLATTIKEFVATIFAYRSRMLELGIEQMLDGKNYSYYWWDKVANFFLWWFYKFKKENRAKDVEDSGNQNDGNPFFSKREINNVKINDPEKPADYLMRVKLNKKAELFAAKITNHPLYKRSSENAPFLFSWKLNKKPAYLNADTFSDILIDILSQNKSTSANSPVLMKDISSFVSNNINNNPELKKILSIYIEQANGDLQRFKLLLENWYNDTMDRVSGWYKKQASRILLMIGFVLAVAFNVSTVEIVNKLSKDKTARDALVQSASEYLKRHVDSVKIPAKNSNADNNNGKGGNQNSDSLNAESDSAKKAKDKNTARQNSSDTSFSDIRQRIDSMKALYNTDISEANTTLGLGWGDFGFTKDSVQYNYYLLYKNDSVKFANDSAKQFKTDSANCKEDSLKIWEDSKKRKDNPQQYEMDLQKYKHDLIPYILDTIKIKNKEEECDYEKLLRERPHRHNHPGFLGKMWYVIVQTISTPRYLLGFLITALAISLGSPFWFDLLNKFINLRASGTKPDDGKKTSDGSKTPGLNKNPDPNAKG